MFLIYRKKTQCIVLWLLAFTSLHSTNTPQKHVIGARYVGMFSNFLGVLNHINWCLKNDKTPVVYWGSNCMYCTGRPYNGSTNVWEYYFEPVSELSYIPGDVIHTTYEAPDNTRIYWIFNAQTQPDKTMRSYFYEHIITPFIRLKPIICEKINSFFSHHIKGKHTIGIHLRGTDKKTEVAQVPPLKILQEAQLQAGPNSQFFIATDEQELLELAKKTLKGNVIYYDSHRSYNGQAIHYNQKFPMDILGEEVIIETMLLAQCNIMVHTCSNVSTAVLFFNPELENILLSAS